MSLSITFNSSYLWVLHILYMYFVHNLCIFSTLMWKYWTSSATKNLGELRFLIHFTFIFWSALLLILSEVIVGFWNTVIQNKQKYKTDYACLLMENIFVSQCHTHYRQKLYIWYSLIPLYITDYTDNFDQDETLVWGNPTELYRSSRYLSRALTEAYKRTDIKGEKMMQTEWKMKRKQQFKNDALNNWNTPSKTGYLNF